MPSQNDIRALEGKGATIRGGSTPLRQGSTNAGLGVGRGSATQRTREHLNTRIESIRAAAAKKPQ